MTVSTTTNKVAYIGNGVATSFAVPFPFLEKEHLKVWQLLNDVQMERTDWTVSGGNMVFETAPADGAQILIMREVPLTQETDYRENEILPAETLERNFDKLTMQVQQLKEQAERAVTVDIFDNTDAASLIPSIRQSVSDAAGYAVSAEQNAQIAANGAQAVEDKAEKDFSNCTKPYVAETYHNGTEWYRLWSDGFIEQAGLWLAMPISVPSVSKISIKNSVKNTMKKSKDSMPSLLKSRNNGFSGSDTGEKPSGSLTSPNGKEIAVMAKMLIRNAPLTCFMNKITQRTNPAKVRNASDAFAKHGRQRGLIAVSHHAANRVGEKRVQPRSGRQNDRQIRPKPHHQRYKDRSDDRRRKNRAGRHSRRGQNRGIDRKNIRHEKERRDSRDDFRANGRPALFQMKNVRTHLLFLSTGGL